MSPPLFELRGVSHVYGDGSVGLADCTLRLEPRSRNALLGANGSGKTTLLQHLNGLLRPTAGQLLLEGAPVDYRRHGLQALRRRVGFVFQNPDRQLFSARVAEDVSFGPLNLQLDAETVRQRVAEALAAVGLSALADRPVHHLSFGQKKRVCIAGVLAMHPDVLVLDEPNAGLDAAMQADLLAVLGDLNARGMTIVLSTHDVDFAYRWADQIHLLAEGRCLASFAAADLPAQLDVLHAAGARPPAVIAVHRALAARGLLPAGPVPRCLEALCAVIHAGGATTPPAREEN